MKKKILIAVFGCLTALINTGAQDINMPDSTMVSRDPGKNKYNCFVKIETISGHKVEAALDGLTADSVFIALVEEKYVKAGGRHIKILKNETPIGIAVDQIRVFRIKYDPNFIYPDDDLNKMVKKLKRENAGKIVKSVFVTAGTLAMVSLSVYTEGAVDPFSLAEIALSNNGTKNVPIPGYNLYVSKSSRTFTIKGDYQNYVRMVRILTKSKTDPFENNHEKNKKPAFHLKTINHY